MSNWGRHYDSNRNQNYQNSYPSYQQTEGRNTHENWTNYGTPQNSGGFNQPVPQNSMTFFSNGTTSFTEDSGYSNVNYYSFDSDSQVPPYNIELDSEVWARAANSQLTPTAGEFIPSFTYQSSNTPQTQDPPQVNQTNYPQRGHSSGTALSNETSSRFRVPGGTNGHENTYQQRRNYDSVKSRNVDNRRQLSIEQSKAEGRKKLLQEAAGLPSSTNVRGASTSSNDTSRWRSRGPHEKSLQSVPRNNEARVFSRAGKSQDHYQQSSRYSPPRKSATSSSPRKERNHFNNKGVAADDMVSRRERLTEQVNRGTLECMVCCELVKQTDHIWSCHNCYHVLHLRCTIKWANTSKSDNGWRCPACQNVTVTTPQEYYCFCGKTVNPEWNRTDTAHSCGEVCHRNRVLACRHYSCIHCCTLLCHPGPCPPCVALVNRQCGCGRSSQSVQCGQVQPVVCGAICNKLLSCGKHRCTQKCHVGECEPCELIIKQACNCGKEIREVSCNSENSEKGDFSCYLVCELKLSCEWHVCLRTCHEGDCGPCPKDPALITHCYCGKVQITEDQRRESCRDPIPTCGQICSKPLPCGQPSSPHECQALCHEGGCPPCEKTTLVRCRCGFMDQEILCSELTTKADDARCQKKCSKKRSCGKHKCNKMCCIEVDHLCILPCNHMLSCGKHRCTDLCHRGHCRPCLESSFEELFCECGTSVVLPPVPCGTKPPPCNKPCTRRHDCDHEVLHTCHSFPSCPPCSVLTTRYCHGNHELRKAVPCHIREFSCGLPCGRPLPCGRHKCIQPCHKNECAANCKQPCTRPRDLCGHPCNAPCHDGECVDSPCKENVTVTCECGHRNTSRPCYENISEYQRIATSRLASKMADVQLGRSVNLDDMQVPRKISIKTLECTEECRVVERNRRLAIGLQIRNPDLTAKLTPRYSDFMKARAKKDQRFCQHVHDKLTELVKLAKESKQKSRSYSFETMNREKRQFVHEYCTHFGCESVAYDAEPKRNVVATAQRDKAWLPSYSLLEVIQREMGFRKVPLLNLNSTSQKSAIQSNVLPVRVALNQPVKSVPAPDTPQIDYFDFTNG